MPPTLSLHRVIQIPSKFKQCFRLFTNRVWHTCSGGAKRVFCTDTYRLTIRESRARDVYATPDDVTTPYEPLYVIVSLIVGFRNLSNVIYLFTANGMKANSSKLQFMLLPYERYSRPVV